MKIKPRQENMIERFFLYTDTALFATEVLGRCAMRWAIEVYFKAKQHPVLLKEQSNHYAAYIASIHLARISRNHYRCIG